MATVATVGAAKPPAVTSARPAGGFGVHLASQMWPDWREVGYVRYDELEDFIEKSMTVAPGSVCLPDALLQDFEGRLDHQLARVNGFFGETEADISLQWSGMVLPRSDLGLEKTRSILSVLKTHLQKKCKADPGQCPAFNRLRLQTDNAFARFAILYERAQNLRQLVALNYLAFNKIMDKFEEHTGLAVKHAFTPRLQQAKFYNSPAVPRLVTEMDCIAKDLILRADSHRPEDLREEFICGVCLDVLRNPVVLSCAHRFCWHCAASSCVSSSSCDDWNCPVCRKVQPVNQEVFTVNSHLQTFIQEHVAYSDSADTEASVAASENGPGAPFSMMPDSSDFDFNDLLRMKGDSWRQQNQERASLMPRGDVLAPPCDPPPPPPLSPTSCAGFDKPSSLKTYSSQVKDDIPNHLNIGLRQPLPQKFVGRWLSLSDDFFAARDGAKAQLGDRVGSSKAFYTNASPAFASAVVAPQAFPQTAKEVVVVGVPTTVAVTPVPMPLPVAQSVAQHAVREAKKPAKATAGDAANPKRKRGRPPADATLTAEERKLNRLKKNRIAAQRSYKKRVENTNKLEEENQDLHERMTQTAAALEVAQDQWRKYAAFAARHGLQSAVEQTDGLLPPPQKVQASQ